MGKIKVSAELLSERLNLPADAVAGTSKLTLCGRKHLLIENHKGIIKYGETKISVDCGDLKLHVCGDGLNLSAMDKSDMLITGRILAIEME